MSLHGKTAQLEINFQMFSFNFGIITISALSAGSLYLGSKRSAPKTQRGCKLKGRAGYYTVILLQPWITAKAMRLKTHESRVLAENVELLRELLPLRLFLFNLFSLFHADRERNQRTYNLCTEHYDTSHAEIIHLKRIFKLAGSL